MDFPFRSSPRPGSAKRDAAGVVMLGLGVLAVVVGCAGEIPGGAAAGDAGVTAGAAERNVAAEGRGAGAAGTGGATATPPQDTGGAASGGNDPLVPVAGLGQTGAGGPGASEAGTAGLPAETAGADTDGVACVAPSALCSGVCVDLLGDAQHCGDCDEPCPLGATCEQGVCGCAGEELVCGGACVDVLTNRDHCGSCGAACADSELCVGGDCACREDELSCEGTCVDPETDAAHCGGCGQSCGDLEVCADGQCVCSPELTLCDGECVDTSQHPDHCGACGEACAAGQTCSASGCACSDGYDACGDVCADLQVDAANCGGCGQTCSALETCSAGVCVSGGPGDDGCEGLAGDVSLREISVYQTVRVPIMQAGQAVASRVSEVVTGRKTLVRALFDVGPGFTRRELSARLWLGQAGGIERVYSTQKIDVSGSSTDANRDTAFEFELAPEQVGEDTEYAVELVECTQQTTALARPRYPETGTAPLAAVRGGLLQLHLVPFDVEGSQPNVDSTMLEALREGFLATYPVDAVEITIDAEPLPADPALDWNVMLEDLAYRRYADRAADDVYYYGLLAPTDTFQQYCRRGCVAGVGYIPTDGVRWDPSARVAMGLGYADSATVDTALHEVGHNHGRLHAPCDVSDGVDASYPYSGGATGIEGWDSRYDVFLPPDYTDFMGYCLDTWFSDYTYNALLDTVQLVNRGAQLRFIEPARDGDFRMLHVSGNESARWGKYVFSGPVGGAPESAVIFNAALQPIEAVTVFRKTISDIDGYSVLVPVPNAGWFAIQVGDQELVRF